MMRVSVTRVVWLCVAAMFFAFAATLGVLEAPNYRVYAVKTGSMLPSISPKSAVLVRRGIFDVGDVITFRTPDGLVTHRLVARLANGTLKTKGDANETVDPGSLSPEAVVGKVVAAPPMVGYWLVYFSSPAGLGSVLALLIALSLLWSIAEDLLDDGEGAGRHSPQAAAQ